MEEEEVRRGAILRGSLEEGGDSFPDQSSKLITSKSGKELLL